MALGILQLIAWPETVDIGMCHIFLSCKFDSQAVKAREAGWQQVTADIAAAHAAAALLREPARRRVLAEAAQVCPL